MGGTRVGYQQQTNAIVPHPELSKVPKEKATRLKELISNHRTHVQNCIGKMKLTDEDHIAARMQIVEEKNTIRAIGEWTSLDVSELKKFPNGEHVLGSHRWHEELELLKEKYKNFLLMTKHSPWAR